MERKKSFAKDAHVYMLLNEKEQKTLYGGWVWYNGKVYITQSELVDILGSSSNIPAEYERSYAVTDHNNDYSVVELTNFYVLTREQFDELMEGPNGSEMGNSGPSSPNGSSSQGSGSSSNPAGGETFDSLIVFEENKEREANTLTDSIYNYIINTNQGAQLSTRQRNLLRRAVRCCVYSVFLRAAQISETETITYQFVLNGNSLLFIVNSNEGTINETYTYDLGEYLS